MAKRGKYDVPQATREKLAELARTNKPRKGRGLVAPVFVRAGVPGKVCIGCLEWKPLEKFARHATCAGGRRNICSTCEGRNAQARNPAGRLANVRRYQKAHPERLRAGRVAYEKVRRGRLVEGPGVSVEEYLQIKAAYGGLCAYCGEPADSMDHVIPLTRGGRHEAKNLVPACRRCNSSKNNKTPEEWLGSGTLKRR